LNEGGETRESTWIREEKVVQKRKKLGKGSY